MAKDTELSQVPKEETLNFESAWDDFPNPIRGKPLSSLHYDQADMICFMDKYWRGLREIPKK